MDKVQDFGHQGRVADAPSGHWVYRLLPRSAWPYAQLARWDRPIGWWLLLWPCWWSLAMAASLTAQSIAGSGTAGGREAGQLSAAVDPLWLFVLFVADMTLFMIGAIAMRGAGCTWNDVVDRKIDAQVARTRSRPLPSGQVSTKQAAGFLAAQVLIGFVVLVTLSVLPVMIGVHPFESGIGTFGLGVASLAIVAVYPFAKRFTDWPQSVLGLAFSWGALMGWQVWFGTLGWPPLALYAGAILWTIGYDTIYAHQDKEDDALVGVRSTARLFGEKTGRALIWIYAAALVFMALAFALAEVPLPAFAGLIAAGLHMAGQIRSLDIDDADQCLALFKSNKRLGWLIFLGLVGGAGWAVLSPQI
ncbi:4-hydroxybenzoate octaprenyltransferase [Notoacmeibacter sp. MSK16QG-6]|uniref:4-hydroxybenzoate octaprenyltransferase n=1 Tax=Notoacmeibacter sp. MSK16QG-6 TaxID=2957982 RepID=UPI00209F02F1|nr:4-hydroxybenzoate octaprenyltransferase [Notoacmeibacter sp. MSK16QG-6]MCP1198246.1 4-hydroxybenzoate octaprenyltransferase [Notoacmeibacter sp. MSK16QG-6]